MNVTVNCSAWQLSLFYLLETMTGTLPVASELPCTGQRNAKSLRTPLPHAKSVMQPKGNLWVSKCKKESEELVGWAEVVVVMLWENLTLHTCWKISELQNVSQFLGYNLGYGEGFLGRVWCVCAQLLCEWTKRMMVASGLSIPESDGMLLELHISAKWQGTEVYSVAWEKCAVVSSCVSLWLSMWVEGALCSLSSSTEGTGRWMEEAGHWQPKQKLASWGYTPPRNL